MANIAVGDVYRIQIVCREGGQNGINTKLVRVEAVNGGVASQQGLADALSNGFSSRYIPLLSNAAVYRGVAMQNVNLGTIAIVIISDVGQGPGTAMGDPLPPQSAGLLILRVEGPRRRNVGRLYIPFPAEGDNATNGGPSVDYGTRANNLGDYFVGNRGLTIGTANVTVSFSLTRRMFNPAVWNPIVSRNVRGFWGTQRRRSFLNRSDLIIV